jgi:protein MpaA
MDEPEIRPSAWSPLIATVAALSSLLVVVVFLMKTGVSSQPVAESQLKQAATEPSASGSDEEPVTPSVPLPVPSPVLVEGSAGTSVLGRDIPLARWGSGPTVLIIASIHGTESAGTHLVQRLKTLLTEKSADFPNDRQVVLMPLVNPDGVNAKRRGNANGVDLNRNFPAENRQNSKRYGLTALSEPEALAIYQTIEKFQPIRIVTLHEPLRCVDYDGPGLELATAIAEVCPLSVKKLGTRPGSMGAFTGEARQIPTITLELPRDAKTQTADELWELYGAAMLVAVKHPLGN